MKYTVSYNQKAIFDRGLDEFMDDKDAQIFFYVVSFIGSCQGIQKDGYHWIAHAKIKADLPLMKLEKRSIAARMKKLCNIGLFELHKDSQKVGRSMYKVTKLGSSLLIDTPMHTDVKGMHTDVKGMHTDVKPMHTDVKGYAARCKAPMHTDVEYTNINDTNITYTNNNRERDFEKKEILDEEKAAPTPELNSDSSKQPAKKEKEKGFAQKEKPSGADLVDWDNAFWQSAEFQWSLSKWFEMMKEQHNKIFYSRDMVVERLRKLHSLLKATNDNRKEEEAVEIIKTATRKGWKDFYKDNNGSGNKQKHTDPHRIKNEVRTEEEEEAHKKKVEESFLEAERIGKLVMEETKELWGL